jgi:putative endonuclease
MCTVYVLDSEKYDRLYIGSTSDLKQRLLSHNQLARKGWTVKYRPWKLIYSEEFTDKSAAMKREKELKSHKGRDFLRFSII